MAATPFPSSWSPNPTAVGAWNNMTPENKQIYGLMSGLSNDGMIRNQNQNAAANRPVRPKPTTQGIGGPVRTKNGTSQSLNYQTGFNANSQAINEGNVMGRLAKEGAGPQSRFSGVNDLRRSQQANDAAQIRRGVQQENSQQFMNNQAARSEVLQTAVSNMAKMYSDMGQRNIDQMSLAAQLQQAMIRNRSNLMNALTST